MANFIYAKGKASNMKYLVAISRENIGIAMAELEGLFGNSLYQGNGTALFESTSTKLFGRLAYTNAVYRFLFSCSLRDLPRRIKEFAWQSIYRENFCVRIHGSNLYSEKDLAGYICGQEIIADGGRMFYSHLSGTKKKENK